MRAKAACTLVAISFLGPQVGGPRHPHPDYDPTGRFEATVSPPAWQVSSRPVLVIGMEGGSDYEFLRVVAAARLRDGRIVALGATSLRVFDPSGGLLRAVGKPGQGPGEFVRPSHLQVGPSDSLFVFDGGTQRLSVFDTSGALLRDARIQGSYAITGAVGRFSDGRWFAKGEDQLVQASAGAIARDTVSFALLTPDMAWGARLSDIPGAYTSAMTAAGRHGVRQTPFSPQVLWQVRGRCLYTASGDSRDVTVTRSDGATVLRLGVEAGPRRVTRGDWDTWVHFMSQPVPREQMAEYRSLVDGIPRMEVLPTLGGLIVDASGFVWLQEYAPPIGEGKMVRVINASGETVATVVIPEGLRLLEVGHDYILGRRLSGMNEEVLVMYSLTREPHVAVSVPPVECR